MISACTTETDFVFAVLPQSVHIDRPQELTLEQTSPGVVEVGVHLVSQELAGHISNLEEWPSFYYN